MRFRYQGYPVRALGGGLTQVYRPSIPLRVIGPTHDHVAFGLLDTGADDTLLPDRFIAMLGVTIQSGMRAPIRGIGGGALTADFGRVDFQLRAHRWSALVGFYAGNQVLLGHAGFLEHFGASFNGISRTVTLRSIGALPAPTMPIP
jgi:hypothetical protein